MTLMDRMMYSSGIELLSHIISRRSNKLPVVHNVPLEDNIMLFTKKIEELELAMEVNGQIIFIIVYSKSLANYFCTLLLTLVVLELLNEVATFE